MSAESMTSMQRVLTALGHQQPDRTPFMLLLTMHGAKELGLTLKEYFSDPANVVEGQLRLRAKFKDDCLYSIFYAPLEVEAMGGEVVYFEDGPANSGEPVIKNIEDITSLQMPEVKSSKVLRKVLDANSILKERVGDEVPIIGVVMSPFSLPVMQLGFPAYFDMMHDRPDLFEILMKKNIEFTVSWANAQLEAGATAIGYFDPVSSPTIVPRKFFLETGKRISKEVISRINGPVIAHHASGRVLPIIDDVVETGAVAMAASSLEDLSAVMQRAKGKISIIGNLNGIGMCRWTRDQTRNIVTAALQASGNEGGFILSDNHGEIPFYVEDDILHEIAETVKTFKPEVV